MQFYRSLSPIQAMTFDLDDTLYDNRPVIRHVEQQVALWLYTHHPVTATKPMTWWKALKAELAKADPWLPNDVSLWRFEQIRHGLIRLGYTEPDARCAATDAMQEVHCLRNLVEVPDVTHQVLGELAAQMPLIAITNGNVDPSKIGLAGYFQLILKAGPDGYAKPHSDMFLRAQQFLAVPAGSILHIGDHLIKDVAGAKKHGFQACWYNDQGLTLRGARKARLLPDVEINQIEQLTLLVK